MVEFEEKCSRFPLLSGGTSCIVLPLINSRIFVLIKEICKKLYIPGRLVSAMRNWDDEVSRYTGKSQYSDRSLKHL